MVGMKRRITEYVQVERFTSGSVDAHGNIVEQWLPAIEVGIHAFAPGSSTEPIGDGQDRVITAPTLYVNTDVVLDPRDRVTVRGKQYEVDGETLEYRSPYNPRVDGNVIKLRKVDG